MRPFLYSVGAFAVLEFIGEIYPGLINNHYCYPLIGCNADFFGYDAISHFSSGIMVAFFLLWQGRHKLWEYAAAGLGVALLWEAIEWSYDTVRASLLHMDLLHPVNTYTQPSGIDTLGDITMGLVGVMVTYAILRLMRSL